jgi:hypothetical protein
VSISKIYMQSSVPRKISYRANSTKGKHGQISFGGFFISKHKL